MPKKNRLVWKKCPVSTEPVFDMKFAQGLTDLLFGIPGLISSKFKCRNSTATSYMIPSLHCCIVNGVRFVLKGYVN